MNHLELKMLDLLRKMKLEYNVTGIKAEFEAEGTRLEEAMRLKDVASQAGLGLNIKIGGCEAIKDMFDAMSLGAARIIGPMVETPYALKKFISASRTAFGEGIENIELLVNIETEVAYHNFDEMLRIPDIHKLKGIVIGRVDMVGSMGMSRDSINSEKILNMSLTLAKKAKDKGLDVVVGGGVSVDSISFFQAFPKGHLDRFETRKVVFQCPAAIHNPEAAFLHAVEFELMWLKNKQNYYTAIAQEDNARIKLMEERYQKGIQKIKN